MDEDDIPELTWRFVHHRGALTKSAAANSRTVSAKEEEEGEKFCELKSFWKIQTNKLMHIKEIQREQREERTETRERLETRREAKRTERRDEKGREERSEAVQRREAKRSLKRFFLSFSYGDL